MTGFVPPPYPHDGSDRLVGLANSHDGGAVDLSIGNPCDPPSRGVLEALASSDTERGYPQSVGSPRFREAAASWMSRRFAVNVDPSAVAACIGTKELVANVPHWLHLRTPERNTLLHPEIAYPTYEMGAVLAGCRAVGVKVDDAFTLSVTSIGAEDVETALALWSNSPGNPAGGLDDLAAISAWAKAHDVPLLSDECYAEFTWDGPPRSVLEHGSDGALAVHSLSKRSNLAGLRVGFYAGDPDLVEYLSGIRRHAGLMVPGPVQAAAVAALEDDAHVDAQRERYRERLEFLSGVLEQAGVSAPLPAGGFYLWACASGMDGRALAERLAGEGGMLVSPGDLFGDAGRRHVRIAVVQPMERLRLVAQRLGAE